MSTAISDTTPGPVAEWARTHWIAEYGYETVQVIPGRFSPGDRVLVEDVVEATIEPHPRACSRKRGLIDGRLMTSQTTALRGVTGIEFGFPRELAEAMIEHIALLPEVGDQIAHMPLGVGPEERLLLVTGGDLQARRNGAEWLSPDGDVVGRLVFYGITDLVPVSGVSEYEVRKRNFFNQPTLAPLKYFEWITPGPIEVPFDELEWIDVDDDLPAIERAAATILDLAGWRPLQDFPFRFALDAPIDAERGDQIEGRMIFETERKFNGRTWLAAHDAESGTNLLPKSAGAVPSQAEAKAAVLTRFRRPIRERKQRQPELPITDTEENGNE